MDDDEREHPEPDHPEPDHPDDQGDLWSAAFDPAANLRVLGDIQRRGMRAAGEIVERLIANVDGPARSGSSGSSSSSSSSSADLGAGVDMWVEMAKRSIDVVSRLATAGKAPPATRVDVEDRGEQETIVLRARRSGQGEPAEIWLHNGTAEARDDLRLHCGDLRSSDATVLPGGLVFDPETVAELPARSSRGITVGLAPGAGGATPGTYRGVVMVTGLPDVWLPVTVIVDP
jgi:hypothetical protein